MADDDQAGLEADSPPDDHFPEQPHSQLDREAQPVDDEQPPRLPFAVVAMLFNRRR